MGHMDHRRPFSSLIRWLSVSSVPLVSLSTQTHTLFFTLRCLFQHKLSDPRSVIRRSSGASTNPTPQSQNITMFLPEKRSPGFYFHGFPRRPLCNQKDSACPGRQCHVSPSQIALRHRPQTFPRLDAPRHRVPKAP